MDQIENKPQKPKKHNHFYASIMAIDPSGKILLGKRRKDSLYTSPAGSSHMHETPIETAIRETFEETGLVVKPYELEPLPTLDTNDRRVCHVFLWRCPPEVSMVAPKSNLDPDQEVEEWKFYSQDRVPLEIHQDENRATSVNNAYMKFYGIKKGGLGSGITGHVAMNEREKQAHEDIVKEYLKHHTSSQLSEHIHFNEAAGIKSRISGLHTQADHYFHSADVARNMRDPPKMNKGGPGSGKVGHTTMHPTEDRVINLTNKLTNESPIKSHLNKLRNGAVLEGVTLRSGKPLYLNLEQSTAHGYTPNDYKEAANIHYDKAQAIATSIQKIRDLKKPVDPDMESIKNQHMKQFRSNMGAAERLGSRMDRTQSKINEIQKPYKDTHDSRGNIKEKVKKSDEQAEAQTQRNLQQLIERRPELAEKHPEWAGGAQPVEKKAPSGVAPAKYERCVHEVKDEGKVGSPWAVCTASMNKTMFCDHADCIDFRKSVVMMGHADSAEVDTAKFAVEYQAAFSSEWAEKFYNIMDGYKYGDIPRVIPLDKGNLYMVRVDDGMYSGTFIKDESADGGFLEDTAKARLERMSIPSLIQFCIAKEWINPFMKQNPQEPQYAALAEKLSVPVPPVSPQATIFDKTRVLELLDKLTR